MNSKGTSEYFVPWFKQGKLFFNDNVGDTRKRHVGPDKVVQAAVTYGADPVRGKEDKKKKKRPARERRMLRRWLPSQAGGHSAISLASPDVYARRTPRHGAKTASSGWVRV